MTRIADIVRPIDDIPTEKVHVALWGVDLELRGMDLATRSDYLAHLFEARDSDDQAALSALDAEIVCQMSFDPEDGSRAFQDGDTAWLKEKAAAVIAPLSFKIQKLSGLDAFAEERLGKGFSTSDATAALAAASLPSAASSSASPENSDSQSENSPMDAEPPSAPTN